MLSPRIGREKCRTLGCRRVSRDSYCRGGDQNGVSDQAESEESVASDSDRKRRRPNPSKNLENHMPHLKIRDMAKRTFFVIENEIPHEDNQLFHDILPIAI